MRLLESQHTCLKTLHKLEKGTMNKRKKSGKNETLEKWIEQTGITRSQIAGIAGVSPAYLNLLTNYRLKTINRKNLIGISVGLYLSMTETNELLSQYKQMPVEDDDIPHFIESGRKRIITNKLQPLYSDLNQLLLLLSLESAPGKLIVVSDSLSVLLKCSEDIALDYEQRTPMSPLERRIYLRIIAERVLDRDKNLSKGHDIEFLISHANLQKYIEGWQTSGTTEDGLSFVTVHFQNLLTHLDRYKNYSVHVTHDTHPFRFELKFQEKQNGLLFFISGNDISNQVNYLEGYTSNDVYLVRQFQKEYEKLQSRTDSNLNTRKALKSHILNLFKNSIRTDSGMDKKTEARNLAALEDA